MSSGEKLRELGRVLRAWVAGEGPISELMLAWLELVTGRYPVDDPKRNAPGPEA